MRHKTNTLLERRTTLQAPLVLGPNDGASASFLILQQFLVIASYKWYVNSRGNQFPWAFLENCFVIAAGSQCRCIALSSESQHYDLLRFSPTCSCRKLASVSYCTCTVYMHLPLPLHDCWPHSSCLTTNVDTCCFIYVGNQSESDIQPFCISYKCSCDE